ncbi:MAG TPA: DUF4382 domain-containing protein [Chitinophagaceae bacterium]|nr:DUF4382 domain-containing protein [Chitinophagaceae bacterium]
MKTRTLVYLFTLVITSIIVVASCKKDSVGDGNARLQVYLTDDPGDYEAVYIDVKDVQINITDNPTEGWQSLQGVKAAAYDLLKLVNDDDTLLADAFIPSGRLHQLRLVLGTENYVKIQGTSQLIKLETPSAQQSGLKLNIQQDIQDGILYTITLDFDVQKSIVKTGNNKYMLKPTIRTILNAVGGSISGVVIPKTFQTVVQAVQGTDTIASTFTDSDGGYLIRGLQAGSYDVFYKPSDVLYKDSLRKSITVQFNTVTRVDTTFLTQ